jgi:hypothetical protein
VTGWRHGYRIVIPACELRAPSETEKAGEVFWVTVPSSDLVVHIDVYLLAPETSSVVPFENFVDVAALNLAGGGQVRVVVWAARWTDADRQWTDSWRAAALDAGDPSWQLGPQSHVPLFGNLPDGARVAVELAVE